MYVKWSAFLVDKVKKVLIVEDEEQLANLLADSLTIFETDSTAMTNPIEAIKHLNEGHKYDCIICDYRMPEMNGIEFFYQLRKMSIQSKFILMSGHEKIAEKHDLDRLELKFIKKPFCCEELLAMINT
jgi:two-component system response regulator HydG